MKCPRCGNKETYNGSTEDKVRCTKCYLEYNKTQRGLFCFWEGDTNGKKESNQRIY